jgi:hypothetical protein
MMKTGGQNEGSVKFSLSELLKLEDERIAAEERMRERERLEAERQTRMAIEEAARTRIAAENEKRRTAREEEARREAMKAAAVEQARLESEMHARALERERELRHELELAAQRASAKSSPSIGMLFGTTIMGGALMLVVLLGVHLGVSKPAADRQLADLETRIAVAEKRAEDADHRAEELRSKASALEIDRNEARAELEKLKSTAGTKPTVKEKDTKPPPVPTTTVPKKDPPKEPVCNPKDPMCFALPSRAG